MRYILIISISFSLLLLLSCKEKIELKGFDNKTWIEDKGGCNGKREQLLKTFLSVKNGLKGHTSDQIISYLGKPDKEDLHTRNQRFFYYYVAAGEHCNKVYTMSNASYIAVRFSAMNLATEISLSR